MTQVDARQVAYIFSLGLGESDIQYGGTFGDGRILLGYASSYAPVSLRQVTLVLLVARESVELWLRKWAIIPGHPPEAPKCIHHKCTGSWNLIGWHLHLTDLLPCYLHQEHAIIISSALLSLRDGSLHR